METWYNWCFISELEAKAYIFKLAIVMIVLTFMGIRISPLALFIYIIFNDWVFYKFHHKKYIDSNPKK